MPDDNLYPLYSDGRTLFASLCDESLTHEFSQELWLPGHLLVLILSHLYISQLVSDVVLYRQHLQEIFHRRISQLAVSYEDERHAVIGEWRGFKIK